MADIKNFSLVGIGQSVQLGKQGLNLVQSNGQLALRNALNSAYAVLKIATPVDSNDATTKAYVDSLVGNLDQSKINSANGFTVVDTDAVAGKVTVSATNGTAASLVATFQSGAGADTNIVFDNSTAGKIVFAAASLEDKADIHLQPKGEDSAVLIGTEGLDGLIQADAGKSLTISGGDSIAENGGDLILRGGSSFEEEGRVIITDASQNSQLTFGFDLSSAQIYANGASANVDLRLFAKGTGVIDVTTRRITNVVNPTGPQDAATKSYVDSLAGSAGVNSVQARSNNIALAASTNVGTVVKGRLTKVVVHITTAYNGGATIAIGTSAAPNSIMSAIYIEETTVGTYELNLNITYTVDTQVVATITGTPTAGAGSVVLEYIQG